MRPTRSVALLLKILIGLAVANMALLITILMVLLSVDDDGTDGALPGASAAAVAAGVSVRPANSAGPTGGPVAGSAPRATGAPAADGPPTTVLGLLDATVAPLERAARDRGIDVSAHLPSADQRAAIDRAGSLAGPEGTAVLAALAEGYAAVGMPFPDIPMEPQGAAEAPAPASAAPAAAAGDPVAVETWLRLTIENAESAAAASGATITLPTVAAREAAVASGDFTSAAAREVIGPLREAYGALGLDFPEPGGAPAPTTAAPTVRAAPASGGAPAPAGGVALTEEQKILRAYFTVQTQEIERAAVAGGVDGAPLAPDPALVQAAIASGDIRSDASRRVLDVLEQSFTTLGLTWRDPAGG